MRQIIEKCLIQDVPLMYNISVATFGCSGFSTPQPRKITHYNEELWHFLLVHRVLCRLLELVDSSVTKKAGYWCSYNITKYGVLLHYPDPDSANGRSGRKTVVTVGGISGAITHSLLSFQVVYWDKKSQPFTQNKSSEVHKNQEGYLH